MSLRILLTSALFHTLDFRVLFNRVKEAPYKFVPPSLADIRGHFVHGDLLGTANKRRGIGPPQARSLCHGSKL